MECETDYGVIVRFFCVGITILANFAAFLFLYYKAYCSQSKNADKNPSKKKINIWMLRWAFGYMIIATVTAAYNMLYRFIIPSTISACRASDTIEEILIVITRAYLLLYFTYRVESAFKGSKFAFKSNHLWIVRGLIITEAIVMNCIWIVDMSITPKCLENSWGDFGTYCSNSGDAVVVIAHFTLDFGLNLLVLGMFVDRLVRAALSLQGSGASSKGQTRRMIAVAVKQTVLTFVSSFSTWILVANTIIEDFDNEQLGWLYPLDFGINVWCVVLMFRFIDTNRNWLRCLICLCPQCETLLAGKKTNNKNNKIDTNTYDTDTDSTASHAPSALNTVSHVVTNTAVSVPAVSVDTTQNNINYNYSHKSQHVTEVEPSVTSTTCSAPVAGGSGPAGAVGPGCESIKVLKVQSSPIAELSIEHVAELTGLKNVPVVDENSVHAADRSETDL